MPQTCPFISTKENAMLNKSTGNMYDFITHTWNTIKGECPHGCTYCYMKRFGKQRPVRFDEKELKTDLGHDNFIFVGSSCDMFADKISFHWISETLEHCWEYYDNDYLFQTKNPNRLIKFDDELPIPTVICTTIESNEWYKDIMQNSPTPLDRAYGMEKLTDYKKYVTIEPILDFDLNEMIRLIDMCNPVQVNIGADSGNNNLPEPPKEKILELIRELSGFTIVKQKNNLARLLK